MLTKNHYSIFVDMIQLKFLDECRLWHFVNVNNIVEYKEYGLKQKTVRLSNGDPYTIKDKTIIRIQNGEEYIVQCPKANLLELISNQKKGIIEIDEDNFHEDLYLYNRPSIDE